MLDTASQRARDVRAFQNAVLTTFFGQAAGEAGEGTGHDVTSNAKGGGRQGGRARVLAAAAQ